jgi:hypothetical protein
VLKERTAWLAVGAAVTTATLAGVFLPVNAYLALVALVFLLAAAAIAATVQIGSPVLGMTALVATAVAFPFEFRGPSGVMMSSSLPLATALCGAWLIRVVAIRRSPGIDRSRVVYAVLVFMAVALMSFAVGLFPLFPSAAPLPAQVAELSLFLLSGCLFLAVGHQITAVAQLRWLTWTFVAAGTITCILQMVPGLVFVARWTTRPGSVGSLFWTWLVAVTLAQALFNRSLGGPARLALLGVTALVLGHGVFQVRSWASGWIPPVVALGAILFLRLPRLSVSLGLLAAPVALFASTYFADALLADEQYSLMTRQEAWRVLWQLVERSPLVGTGPANYYYYTENFPLLGWYVRFISHNNYQDLLIQTGFLGLLAFAWFAFEAGWLALRLYVRAPVGFPKAYVAGAFGGLAGSLVAGMLGDWIIPFYYNAGILGFRSSLLFWVFLGGMLAVKRLIEAPATHRLQTAPAYAARSREQLLAPQLVRW